MGGVLSITNLNEEGSWWGTMTGTLIFGFALAPLFPGAMLLAEETLGRGMLGTEAAVIVVLAALGESFCPGIIGLVMTEGITYFGWAFLVMCSFSGLFFVSVLKSGGT